MRGADYRAIGAAAYLGVGSVWALGLSSSAALIMAAPASLPDVDREDQRRHSARARRSASGKASSIARVLDRRVDGDLLLLRSGRAPTRAAWRDMGVDVRAGDERDRPSARRPGEWLEYSPLLTIVVGALGFGYLVARGRDKGPAVLLDLNHYVFLFLIAGCCCTGGRARSCRPIARP